MAGMQSRRHSRQRRNAVGDVGRQNHGVSCELRPPRKLDGCQLCRTSSRTGSGKLRCHQGDGKVRRIEVERDANAKQRRSRGQQSARHEGGDGCSVASASPGGTDGGAGCGGIPAALMPETAVGDHGKLASSKYTSEVTTI
eukprot:6187524-Pleurochrysis_carterae.AAC.1